MMTLICFNATACGFKINLKLSHFYTLNKEPSDWLNVEDTPTCAILVAKASQLSPQPPSLPQVRKAFRRRVANLFCVPVVT